MSRVSISVPDDVITKAKAAGMNISRLATNALEAELERRDKTAALDRHLEELEMQFGPIPEAEAAEAKQWADRVLGSEEPSAQQTA